MSKRKQNTIALKRENLINRLRILLIAALTIITFYPPYLQGLYFEKHVLPTQIIVFATFIVFLIYKLLKKDYTFFRTPIDYACLGFVIVYFISIFVAVHTRSAIIEWLKYCMYFAVFYMISDLADNHKIKLLFLWTIVISAVGVSIIGLDAALGGNFVKILNKFFNLLGVKGNLFFGLFGGIRIHSTLQYPNALASYLMAVFFVTIGLLMVYSRWWQKLIVGSFSFILFVTFMLTQSRGAQLLFPVVILLLLLVLPKGNRIYVVTHVILLAIPAGITSLFIIPYLSSDVLNQKALLYLFMGLIITTIISLFAKLIGGLLQKVNWKIYAAIIIVCIIVSTIVFNNVINSSVPVELSLMDSEENRTVSVSRDVALEPNKDYILKFIAESKMIEEKPYAFFVRVSSKNLNNILFYNSEQLLRENFSATDGPEEFDILFSTKEDTKLININFAIYYSGTSAKLSYAAIIDADTGKIVKNLVLKNKYNLDRILTRFQNIWLQHSLVTRAIFYKDGLKIFKNRWFLGAGGGAWGYLYRQYQSYNYNSNQAHNYPLQLGIETGILGITILLTLVFMLIYAYIKYYKKINNTTYENFEKNINFSYNLLNAAIITAIASLFMHSVIDFDFSESSILLLFWSLIALFNTIVIEYLIPEDLKLLIMKRKENFVASVNKKIIIFLGIIISTITLYFATTFFIASTYANQSFECIQNKDIDTAINMMEKAIMFDRFNEKYVLGLRPIANRPDVKVGLIDILLLKNDMYEKAIESGEEISETDVYNFKKQLYKASLYIQKIEKNACNNLYLTSDLAAYYLRIGETDKGIELLNLAISYYPFEPSLWHAKINVYYQLMATYYNNGNYDKAKEYLIKGLKIINEAKEINKKNINPFVFNQETVELLQKMEYLKDNWDTEEIHNVNNVIHYSMFDLDVNMDGSPDQWRASNVELIKISVDENILSVKPLGVAYIYTYYPLRLKKEKSYRIIMQIKEDKKRIEYYVLGITSVYKPLVKEKDYYVAEFTVEKEPSESGNQLRIYIESDCTIENIIVQELN